MNIKVNLYCQLCGKITEHIGTWRKVYVIDRQSNWEYHCSNVRTAYSHSGYSNVPVYHATFNENTTYCGLGHALLANRWEHLSLSLDTLTKCWGTNPNYPRVDEFNCQDCIYMLLEMHVTKEIDWRPKEIIAEDFYAF